MTHTVDHSAGLPSDPLDRALQLLAMGREQLGRAQGGAGGAHLEYALVGAGDMIDEAEATGEAERRWFPTYRAA